MDDMSSSLDFANREIEGRLAELEVTHRELDELVAAMHIDGADMLRLQRLKRRKLQVKDEIQRLRAQLCPNIIA